MPYSENEPMLADEFIATSYEIPKHHGWTGRRLRDGNTVFERYRSEIRRAHRFVLDDDFVRLAVEVSSYTKPEKLLARLHYSTLPYELVWLEHDLLVKVRALRRIHQSDNTDYSGIGKRIGYLIYRIDETKMLVTAFVQMDEDPYSFPMFTSYFVSLEPFDFLGEGFSYAGCEPFAAAETLDVPAIRKRVIAEEKLTNEEFAKAISEMDNMAKASLWGYTPKGVAGGLLEPGFLRNHIRSLVVPTHLHRHGDAAFSRFWKFMIEQAKKEPQMRYEQKYAEFMRIVNVELLEFTGTIRFLVTVLSMLNEVPIYVHKRQPEGTMRSGLIRRSKKLDHHVITLRVPKLTPADVERHFRESSRHRAHMVRAHWRTYLLENHCPRDHHDWEYDSIHGYRLCGKCFSYGRLIPEHVRGDPTLGWVDKSYIVKAAI